MEPPLYDLSPVLHIMLMGVVVALAPLAWMWLRNKQAAPARRLQALTLLVLFLTFDLVLFGAFTRLTDSGLGCPDWPGCYGQASPSGARAQIAQAQGGFNGPIVTLENVYNVAKRMAELTGQRDPGRYFTEPPKKES